MIAEELHVHLTRRDSERPIWYYRGRCMEILLCKKYTWFLNLSMPATDRRSWIPRSLPANPLLLMDNRVPKPRQVLALPFSPTYSASRTSPNRASSIFKSPESNPLIFPEHLTTRLRQSRRETWLFRILFLSGLANPASGRVPANMFQDFNRSEVIFYLIQRLFEKFYEQEQWLFLNN